MFGFRKHLPIITRKEYNTFLDLIIQLTEVVQSLETRIQKLEEENVETTNELYRLENSLDSRIDILAESPWKEQFDV